MSSIVPVNERERRWRSREGKEDGNRGGREEKQREKFSTNKEVRERSVDERVGEWRE